MSRCIKESLADRESASFSIPSELAKPNPIGSSEVESCGIAFPGGLNAVEGGLNSIARAQGIKEPLLSRKVSFCEKDAFVEASIPFEASGRSRNPLKLLLRPIKLASRLVSGMVILGWSGFEYPEFHDAVWTCEV